MAEARTLKRNITHLLTDEARRALWLAESK
jgi:hypothetical protein